MTMHTPHRWQRTTATLVAAVLALLPVASAPAAADGGDTTAVAINTRDGASVFRLAFQIRRIATGAIDQQNAAVAYASCTECQTVALAFQVVLAMGDTSVVTPENYAIAVNQDCSDCTTLAAAYQFVLGTNGAVRFTPDGSRALAELRLRLLQLRDADLTPDEFLAELDAIAAELARILDEELLAAGAESTTSQEAEEDVAPSEEEPSEDGSQADADPTESPVELETVEPSEEAPTEAAETEFAPTEETSE